MDCIFCKIAASEIPSQTVMEDADIKIFKDIHPKAPVHLLCIPKVHVQSIAHLKADHSDMIAKMLYAARDVASKMGLAGYKLVFNVGREGGQVVDHLHLHILGGWTNNGNKES